MPVTSTTVSSSRAVGATRLAVTIFLVALNLRAALAALPPLASTIQDDLSLSGAQTGLLTTLPVLCMGLFAPVATQAARRVGREMTVAGALLLMFVGQLLRLGGGVLAVLVVSTFLVGVGIAFAGTVLPGIVKEHFTGWSGLMTGV
jgi:CP family cyanate transporter-like MFS transporter